MTYRGQQRSMLQILVELREDEPEFRQAMVVLARRPGQAVATPDEFTRYLFTLMKGRVQLIHEADGGRRLAVALLDPGAMFGEGALPQPAAGSSGRVSALALTDCLVWALPATQAQELARRYPVLCWGLLQTVGARLAQAEDRMEDVAYRRLSERLAGLLLELSTEGRAIGGTSHQALADMLGTYRETISAILRHFKESGLVELGYRKIELRDVRALRATAGILQ